VIDPFYCTLTTVVFSRYCPTVISSDLMLRTQYAEEWGCRHSQSISLALACSEHDKNKHYFSSSSKNWTVTLSTWQARNATKPTVYNQ